MRRRDNQNFRPADFMRPDPWRPRPAVPPPDPAQQLFDKLDAYDWG